MARSHLYKRNHTNEHTFLGRKNSNDLQTFSFSLLYFLLFNAKNQIITDTYYCGNGFIVSKRLFCLCMFALCCDWFVLGISLRRDENWCACGVNCLFVCNNNIAAIITISNPVRQIIRKELIIKQTYTVHNFWWSKFSMRVQRKQKRKTLPQWNCVENTRFRMFKVTESGEQKI